MKNHRLLLFAATRLRKSNVTILGLVGVVLPSLFGVLSPGVMHAQLLHSTGRLPSFEVASIRADRQDASRENPFGFSESLSSYLVRGITIKQLISYAWGVGFAPELSGGPKWTETERFDIEAKPSDATAVALSKLSPKDKDEQLRLMVQSLLTDRFGLKVTFEKRDLPMYRLVLTKGGLKCSKSKDSPSASLSAQAQFAGPPPPPPPPAPGLVAGEKRFTPKGWHFADIVAYLSSQQEVGGRRVIDRTGIQGDYDCSVSWASDGSTFLGASFFTAIQDDMGLKLETTTGPDEVLVVNQISRPSQN